MDERKKTYYPAGGRSQTSSAGSIVYDNTSSGLTAGNVQDAIDEVVSQSASPEAADVSYDNTSSGLTATDVQAAIDEVVSGATVQEQADWTEADTTAVSYIKNKPTLANVAISGDASDVSYDNTTSGLEATDVQDAIDEVDTNVKNLQSDVGTKPSGETDTLWDKISSLDNKFVFVPAGTYYVGAGHTTETWDISDLGFTNAPLVLATCTNNHYAYGIDCTATQLTITVSAQSSSRIHFNFMFIKQD